MGFNKVMSIADFSRVRDDDEANAISIRCLRSV